MPDIVNVQVVSSSVVHILSLEAEVIFAYRNYGYLINLENLNCKL